LTHDWLARPVPRLHWLLAKLLFMLLVIFLPVIAGRFALYLGQGYGLVSSLVFAAAIEKLPATLPVPLLFAIGLLAPNLRRAIALMIILLLVILIPAWSATRPLLEMIGIDLGSELDSMMWLQGIPMFIAGMLAAMAVFWWLFCRRQLRIARMAFAICTALLFFSIYPPQWLMSWDRAINIHRWLMNEPGAESHYELVMEPLQACYPASVIGSADSRTSNPLMLSAAWEETQLRLAGANGLTMATTVRARLSATEWLYSSAA